MKLAILRALIVLIPSYTVAYLTEQMVWTIPTMVAAGFFAAAVSDTANDTRNHVDGDGDADGSDGHEHGDGE